ncbi:MAG: hypothetical protein ACRYFR_15270 [Janthinobacterium lividum]
MRVYQEVLPNSCLLILTDSDSWAGLAPLARALRWAQRQPQRRVWVDCSSLADLSAHALFLLRQGANRLHQRGGCLVLCHPPASLSEPQAEGPPPGYQVAASLLDADQV